jgi:hypothetical protein
MHTISSLIQTILSVLELHQFMHMVSRFSEIIVLADFTAGRELHPAPKIQYEIS